MLTSILPVPIRLFPEVSLLTIFCIACLGLMGLRLPTQRFSAKLLYTALEFGILSLPVILNSHIRFAPFLGIVVLIRGCQMFKLPGRLVVAGLVYIAFVLPFVWGNSAMTKLLLQAPGTTPEALTDDGTFLLLQLNATLSIGLVIIFVLLLVNSLLTERQSRQQLAIAHEQLRQYALRIEDQATLQERNRIAREIHDSLGHALTAQSIQLENALLFCPENAEQVKLYLTQAKKLGSKALQEVRQSVATLRFNPLRGQTLKTMLAHIIDDFRHVTGIAPNCYVDILAAIPPEVSMALYRIVQEALTNVCKHSAATQVSIDLQEKMGAIVLRILDDGRGFNPEHHIAGFGIQGMRERTTALGGQFSLVSEPGKGCLVEVIVPIPLCQLNDASRQN
jgi:signal transduction histidine kinase